MKKRLFSLLMALAMVLSVMPVAAFAEDGEAAVSGNLLKVTTEADFAAGTLENLEIVPDVGNGAVRLTDGATEGTFVSQVYSATAFDTVVASWNTSLYDGTEVEIWARARQDGQWSDWLSWGPYSPYISRGSTANKGGALAGLYDDIFEMDEGTADGIQLKAEIRRDDAETESPVLRQITATFSGGEMVATYAEEALEELPGSVLIAAPAYAQGIRHPSIGDSICSPTTMTVMMNSRVPELDLLPEELALNVQDEGEGIFGNWSFCTAGAGLYGFESYFQFANLEILLQELAQGRPVGLGVSYKSPTSTSTSNYPVLEGAYGSTGGHLITLIGYEYEEGYEGDPEHLYFYSSNSYAANDSTAYHRYKWNQLDQAWSRKSTYIIPSTTQEEGADVAGVTRVQAQMQASESDRTSFTFVDADGEALDMSRLLSGGGVLGYTVEGFVAAAPVDSDCSVAYPESMRVTANDIFYYDLSINDDGSVKLDTNAVLENLGVPYGEVRDITVYAFGDRGYMYVGVIEASIIADEVVVTAGTEATGSKVESVVYADQVEATVTVNDMVGEQVTLGLLIPEGVSADQAVVTVDGASAAAIGVYVNEEGVSYLEVPVSADASAATVVVDWAGTLRTYEISLAGVTKAEDVVLVEGNLVSIDLTSGRANGQLEYNSDGALALAEGETYGEYYSPVYDSFDWEYGIPTVSAYVPGDSSVDIQIRAFTERQQNWSEWFSLGKVGVGAASTSASKQGPDVNVDPDIFTLRGSSSTANALRWQVRLVLRGNGEDQPAVYYADMTFKKSSYDASEAGEIDTSALPASAGVDAEGYSAYNYVSGMSSWRFENMELIMMNALGSDLLFEEVALGGYDQNAGWGNWAMTNYKPGLFGHHAYTQYAASAALIQKAIAEGNVVGVYVSGAKVPGTNSNASSQTVVTSYYTAEDGTVMFKVICPRGDGSELAAGKVYGEISAADLDAAIAAMSSSSARGIMYVVAPQTFESSWQRIEAEAEMVNTDNDAFVLYADGEQVELPSGFNGNYKDFGNGGAIGYTLTSATDPQAKLAAGDFSYGITVNSDGTLAVSDSLKTALLAGDTANIYVIANNGVTYVAELAHTHLWDEGVETVAPSTKNEGEVLYTCEYCGETYIEYLPEIITPVGPSLSQTTVSKSVTAANKKLNALAKLDTVTLEDQEAIEEARAAYDALSDEEKEQVENYDELLKAEAALAALLNTGSEPFADVTDGDWFQDSVIYVYENGLMNGVTADSFAPQANTTRGMIVTILWRMAGEPAPNGVNGFADVAAGSYYEQAITWAAEAGIVTGYTDTQFKPDDSITREQLAVILFRYAQFRGLTSVVLSENLWFNDADQISSYAVSAMNWAVYEELITGTGNGNVEPQGYANRAQVATILARFCQNIQ